MNAIDVALFHWINASADSPSWWIDWVAEYSEHTPSVVISCMLGCLLLGNARLRKGMVCCLSAMVVAWCLTRLIRWGVPLERPYDLGMGTRWIAHGSRPRFPSLHAAVAFAFAGGVTLWCCWGMQRWLLPVLAWAAAGFIGWSRIYVGVHLPFDIGAGLITGLLSVWLVQRFMPQRLAPGKSAAYSSRPLAPWANRK